ncbi:hypothetical protein PE066_07655 [Ramlibacter tataouinensis]|uniref:hypothetical protein n=1 Tax=Ramlibacter tataouinensis TaxID=94132 RepID=UPI0022F407F0|nr:hypothetical protein [Ramlibacter tataouinensis]WBY03396.1 hypothetical protein PE066_07655 [Ramlibacter tataouinensis]
MQTKNPGFLLSGWQREADEHAAAGVPAGWGLAALAFGLFLANAALHFPGVMNNDSIGQYRQAISGEYGDWHPPIMAWLWSWLRLFGDGPAPLLLLHLALYWLGFGLVADAVRRGGHRRLACAVLLAGAFPPFLYVNAQVVKDVGMAVAWLAAAGLLYWHRSQQRRMPVAIGTAVALLVFYGAMVRTNALFGLGPLLLYALAPADWLRNARLMAAAVVVAVLALPVSQFANQWLFQPKAEHATQSLFLYDLAGIAVHAGDPRVMEPRATFTREQLRACYSPYWWDSFSPWGRCAAQVHRPAGAPMATLPDGLEAQWLRSIATHPLAYLQHRLKHFNSALLFAVPPKHIRLTPEYRTGDPAHPPLEVVTARDVKLDIVRKNPGIWPVTWLAWAACLLALLRGEPPAGAAAFARVLAVSALSYSGAYLLIGVATDMRYHYWSLLAVMLATLAVLPLLGGMLRRRPRPLLASAAVVLAVVALGVATRLLDFRGLV